MTESHGEAFPLHAALAKAITAAGALVAGALVICEVADLEMSAMLLRDAQNSLAEDLDDLWGGGL